MLGQMNSFNSHLMGGCSRHSSVTFHVGVCENCRLVALDGRIGEDALVTISKSHSRCLAGACFFTALLNVFFFVCEIHPPVKLHSAQRSKSPGFLRTPSPSHGSGRRITSWLQVKGQVPGITWSLLLNISGCSGL